MANFGLVCSSLFKSVVKIPVLNTELILPKVKWTNSVCSPMISVRRPIKVRNSNKIHVESY